MLPIDCSVTPREFYSTGVNNYGIIVSYEIFWGQQEIRTYFLVIILSIVSVNLWGEGNKKN